MNRWTALAAMCIFTSIIASGQMGGKPGSFSRVGFGARGMGMGNAMTAVLSGDIAGYYNPAAVPWATTRSGSASFGILSLDRNLNFLQYAQPLKPLAGISVGLINAGVHNIDGRDADGEATGPLRISENQVQLGFGVRFTREFSAGLNFKLYYFQLYTDIASTTIGIDLGALYVLDPTLTLGLTVRDINSKYKWDTSDLYGTQGSSTTDAFPLLYAIGAAWQIPDSLALLAADVEFSNASTMTLRVGIEVPIFPELTVRGGVDRIDLKVKGAGIRPALGFTIRKDLGGWTPAVNYAFILEPFSPSGIHMISLGVIF